LPAYLKEAGYSTHLIGKWHLGWANNGTLPLERGFDSFYGILGAEFHPFVHSSGRPMLYDGENLVDQSGDYATYLFSNRAEEIVRKPSSKPKFIYLSYTAPHAPHAAPFDLKDQVREELMAIEGNQPHSITKEFVTYQARDPPTGFVIFPVELFLPYDWSILVYESLNLAMIRAMDIGIKQVYEAAQEQSDRETILVFTSDNGAATRYRPWGILKPFPNSEFYSATGCNFPLKGQKSSLNEAGFPIF